MADFVGKSQKVCDFVKMSKPKVIGQIESGHSTTQSGQPKAYKNVYDDFGHPSHKGDFNAHEHLKAAEINETRAEKIKTEAKIGTTGFESQMGQAKKHLNNAMLHRTRANDLKSQRS